MARNLVVLGSTGSIGTQTLDVASRFPERMRVYGIAGRRVDIIRAQIDRFRPAVAVHGGSKPLDVASEETEFLEGEAGMVELVSRPEVDLVVVATTGRAGLLPTMAAIRAGKLVALANKEVLVMAGSVIGEALKESTAELVPIDSEHSAIWQCLQGEEPRSIERLTLTASGGALRSLARDELDQVTPEQALRHPTWHMGTKITIDCANLMNKGLEVIEAQWLFDVPIDRIDVILHPQSIIHSLVTFDDSSTKAQLGVPDMRLPIQYALSHPERWSNDFPRLDFPAIGELTFGSVNLERYAALRIAIEAGKAGGTYPAILCAADEVAVEMYLEGRIRFTDIPRIVEGTLSRARSCQSPTLDDILEADAWGRETARSIAAP
jgi:1-deoxy-D-xylulose-5-phosphate reductoisomerase